MAIDSHQLSAHRGSPRRRRGEGRHRPALLIAVAAAGFLGCSAVDGAAQPVAPIEGSDYAVAGWVGAGFVDRPAGRFAYCRQARAVDDDIMLTFTLGPAGDLDVGMIGGSLPSAAGAVVPTAARLDDIGPVALVGVVDDLAALVLPLDDDPAIVDAFRRSYVFEIAGAEFGPLAVDLSGTAASLTELRRCAAAYREIAPTPDPDPLLQDPDPDAQAVSTGQLRARDLAGLQTRPATADGSGVERQSFDRQIQTGLAQRLTGGAGRTITDGDNGAGMAFSPAGQRSSAGPPPAAGQLNRPYRIGGDGTGFGSGGLYGAPYTVQPPSAPYSISTPGTASPYSR